MNSTLTTLFAGIGLWAILAAIGFLLGWHLTGIWLKRKASKSATPGVR